MVFFLILYRGSNVTMQFGAMLEHWLRMRVQFGGNGCCLWHNFRQYAFKYLLYTYIFTFFCRALLFNEGIRMYNDFLEDQGLQRKEGGQIETMGVYDPTFLFIVRRFRYFQMPNSLVFSSLLPLLLIYYDYLLTFQLDLKLTRLFYLLFVENQSGGQLGRCLPILSVRLRVRLVVFSYFIDYLPYLAFTGIAIFIVSVFLTLLYTILGIDIQSGSVSADFTLPHFDSIDGLVLLLDAPLFIYSIYNFYRMCIFFIDILLLVAFIVRGHLKDAHQKLRGNLLSYLHVKNAFNRFKLTLALAQFRAEHTFFYQMVDHLDRTLISRFVFAFFATTTLQNLYAVATIVYQPIAFTELSLLLLALYLQTLAVFLGTVIVISISSRLHEQTTSLFTAQMALQSASKQGEGGGGGSGQSKELLLTKLKLAAYYEIVNSEKKMFFHLGSLAKISKRSFYRVTT
ncbi:hypothetical protein TYRP_022137 [Tyrophagus putrescentiae]|nr:hypothetical protein TYRP_022137 [Tyrophagus putrescentiae]